MRPEKIELQEPTIKIIHKGTDIPSMGQAAIIFLKRDEEFLKKANYEIDFEITQAGKTVRVKLKDPRKMVEDFSLL